MKKSDRYPPLTFFHIPKTAGTSLTRFLRQLYGRDSVCRVFVDPPEMKKQSKVWTGHFNWESYEDHHRDGALSMVFLRNPTERLLSVFYFSKAQIENGSGWFGQTSAYNKPLLSVLRSAVEDRNNEHYGALRNACVKHLVGQGTIQQTLQMQLSSEHADDAIAKLEAFNILGLTERMSDSRRCLLNALKVSTFRPDVPVVNTFEEVQQSQRHKALEREDITEEASQMIDELTGLDWELYRAAEQMFDAHMADVPAAPPPMPLPLLL